MEENLSRQKFLMKDFSQRDLRGTPMHDSEFILCNFNHADMRGCDCRNSKFSGSTMVETNVNGTNFAGAHLGCKFHPSDCNNMILTMNCFTFRNMQISRLWWYGWKFFGLMMIPEKENGVDPRDADILAMGAERYSRYKRIFKQREL